MTALYYADLDCTPASRAIAHPDTVHKHFTSEREACLEFIDHLGKSFDRWDAGDRYRCIRGPGGIVRGVAFLKR